MKRISTIRLRRITFFAGLSLTLLGIAAALWWSDDPDSSRYKKVQEDLDRSFQRASGFCESVEQNIANGKPSVKHLNTDADTDGIFVFHNDSLIAWSSGVVPVPNLADERVQINGEWFVLRMPDGWYAGCLHQFLQHRIVVVHCFYKDYQYDNAYLVDGFTSSLPYKAQFVFPWQLKKAERVLYDPQQAPVLAIEEELEQTNGANFSNKPLWLIVLGLFVLIGTVGAEIAARASQWGRLTAWLVFCILLIGIRTIAYQESVRQLFTDEGIFSPKWYASSALFPSLGDFLFNGLLLLLGAAFLFQTPPRLNKGLKNLNMRMFLAGLMLLGTLYGARVIVELAVGLLLDGKINLSVTNIMSFNLYSYIAYLSLGALFLAMILFALAIGRMIVLMHLPARPLILLYLALGTAHGVALFVFSDFPLMLALWPTLLILLSGWFMAYQNNRETSLQSALALLALFAITASSLITFYSDRKERDSRVLLAERIAAIDDPIAEILFDEMHNRIRKDNKLLKYLNREIPVKEDIVVYLEDRYFKDYWDRYEIEYYFYNSDSSSAPFDPYALSREYDEFMLAITEHCDPSQVNDFIYPVIDYYNKLSYLVNLPIGLDTIHGFLVAELRSKQLPDDIGFPELLIDKNTKSIQELATYSVARYSNNKLVTRLGLFNYPVDGHQYNRMFAGKGELKHLFFDDGNMEHLLYRGGGGSLLLISRPLPSLLLKATTFSYLLVFFGVMLAIATLIIRLIKRNKIRFLSGLNSKIQVMLVAISLVTLVLFGLGTRYFILEEYTGKNNRLISEKVNSVHEELSKRVGREERLIPPMKNYLNFSLKRFSEVFFTDISLYDPSGTLLASSRNEVFHAGLLSQKMDPTAFRLLHEQGRSEVIQEEHIGQLKYLCAYAPFIGRNGTILGYISLPYFAKQNPLENEISNLLVTLINIFVLLLALSVLAALFVANWVTKPLQELQDSLSSIRLGKLNRTIKYSGHDEIGSLVAVYNQKVIELEEAALALARSERESAWREMARQVAHEIKNPLTPMKLSVQHFQRSFNKDAEDTPQRISRFTGMLIEQIDTLTHIADEFSSFAKMPKSRAREVEANEVVQSIAELFANSTTASIHAEIPEIPCRVYMDKDELTRICTNLVKNAVQSLEEKEKGLVIIRLSASNGKVTIMVEDNGHGIPHELKERIFTPNFTTKSSGTGLGLAMVRNIVEQADGRIWFEDAPVKGTRFFVELPQFNAA